MRQLIRHYLSPSPLLAPPTGGEGEFGGVGAGFILAREPLTFIFSIDNKSSGITLPQR